MATAKTPAKKRSPEQVQAAQLLATWREHSDLMAVKVNIVGQVYHEDGSVTEVDLGTIPGSLRQFNPAKGHSQGSFGFSIAGKVPDLSPAGVTGKGFQITGNMVAIRSREWPVG